MNVAKQRKCPRLQSRHAKHYVFVVLCVFVAWSLIIYHAWRPVSSFFRTLDISPMWHTTFPPLVVDPLAEELNHPTFTDVRIYERNLPQHEALFTKLSGKERPRYLWLPNSSWGTGWNNVFQEQLLNTHLAYLSQRAYVFPDYLPRDHPPFPDTLANGTRHLLHVPMNALVSGPTGGGPLGESDNLMRRAVSEEWWAIVCPPEQVVEVDVGATMLELGLDAMNSDGEEMMAAWAGKLRDMSAPCVSVVGTSVFNYMWVGGRHVVSLWPSYGTSPTLQYFAWSPLITAALFRNSHVLGPHAPPASLAPVNGTDPYTFDDFLPYRTSELPVPGLLGVHVRRGDYEGHCSFLADVGADYQAWNLLGTPGITDPAPPTPNSNFKTSTPHDYVWPALPDYLSVSEGQSRRDAALAHCWPSAEAIVAKAHTVRASAASLKPKQDLRHIFIATNGDPAWVGILVALLQADGWEVSSSLDMALSREEQAVSQAVDMGVLTSAEAFIGDGFSSLSSNVMQIRLAGGRDARTIHFW
ncbi:hypothetical protein B0H19DRAFT_1160368 [Mycena capillaripes]|nr:hypothetical protein B0H19DRAFT_1160368 [Mycena capillaripes]